jgi:hypothetical protein
MILILFGLYALIAAKLQISRHYGLKGTGARVAGAVCIAFGVGIFALLSVPLMLAAQRLGMGDAGAAGLGVAVQIVAFVLVLVILVRIYGNAYAKTSPPTA